MTHKHPDMQLRSAIAMLSPVTHANFPDLLGYNVVRPPERAWLADIRHTAAFGRPIGRREGERERERERENPSKR